MSGMKEKQMLVIVKQPGCEPEIEPLMPNSLAALQDWVGGKIETVTVASDCVIICNEEARMKGLPYNCKLCGMEFYGPLMLAGRKSDEFCSLKGSEIPFLLKSLRGGIDK